MPCIVIPPYQPVDFVMLDINGDVNMCVFEGNSPHSLLCIGVMDVNMCVLHVMCECICLYMSVYVICVCICDMCDCV